jgi:uncharacterized protein (TIGR02145 family)
MEGRKDGISSLMSFFGIFGIFLIFGFVSAFIYSPVFKTNATVTLESSSKDVDVTVNVDPVLSLSLDSYDVLIETDINSFDSSSVNVSVDTNSAFGYTLMLEDDNFDTHMYHFDDSIETYFSSDFLGAKTSAEMPENSWGFSVDGTNYYKIPIATTPAYIAGTYENPVPSSVTTVNFGVKTGVVPSGYYSDRVLFTAYVNGEYGPEKYFIEPGTTATMQDFGYWNCEAMEVGGLVKLQDERDGTYYDVRKVGEGYDTCYMTSDLKIGASSSLNYHNTDMHDETFAINEVGISDFATVSTPNNKAYLSSNSGFYTWYTVTAGSSVRDYEFEYAESSICPAGWNLPTVGQYRQLIEEQSFNTVKRRLQLNDSGLINNSGQMVTDEDGYGVQFWTQDIGNDATKAKVFAANNNGAVFREVSQDYGLKVRCKVQPLISM